MGGAQKTKDGAASAVEAAAELLAEGGSPQKQASSRGSRSALHAEAAIGNATQLSELLRKGELETNAGDQHGWTAFHCACAGGHVDCIHELLNAGCDTTLVNETGLSGWELALHL